MDAPQRGSKEVRIGLRLVLIGLLAVVVGLVLLRHPGDDYWLRISPIVLGSILGAFGKRRIFVATELNIRPLPVYGSIALDLFLCAYIAAARLYPVLFDPWFGLFTAGIAWSVASFAFFLHQYSLAAQQKSAAKPLRIIAFVLFFAGLAWIVEYPLVWMSFETMHLGFMLSGLAFWGAVVALILYSYWLVPLCNGTHEVDRLERDSSPET